MHRIHHVGIELVAAGILLRQSFLRTANGLDATCPPDVSVIDVVIVGDDDARPVPDQLPETPKPSLVLRVIVEDDSGAIDPGHVAFVDLVTGEEVEIGPMGVHPLHQILVGEPDTLSIPCLVRGDVLDAVQARDPERTILGRRMEFPGPLEGPTIALATNTKATTEVFLHVRNREPHREAVILEHTGIDSTPCSITRLELEFHISEIRGVEGGEQRREPKPMDAVVVSIERVGGRQDRAP